MSQVAVFAGSFASQPLAFAHLLDAADTHGLALDFDHIEVIHGDPSKRLGHVFSAADCQAIAAARLADDALVLVFPEALIPGAQLFGETAHLRRLGQFAPTRKRTLT